MKRSLLNSALAISMLTAGMSASYAQSADNNQTVPFSTQETKSSYELKTFNAKASNGKVFINWTVTDATGECVYIIERSTDGINYQKISAKKGAPSPGNLSLMFSHVDQQPVQGKSFYRVMRAGANENAFTPVASVESAPVKTGNETTSGLASNK